MYLLCSLSYFCTHFSCFVLWTMLPRTRTRRGVFLQRSLKGSVGICHHMLLETVWASQMGCWTVVKASLRSVIWKWLVAHVVVDAPVCVALNMSLCTSFEPFLAASIARACVCVCVCVCVRVCACVHLEQPDRHHQLPKLSDLSSGKFCVMCCVCTTRHGKNRDNAWSRGTLSWLTALHAPGR